MNVRFQTLLIALAAMLVPRAVRAEVFLLANGGRIEGQWLNQEAEPLIMYEIAMSGGGRLTVRIRW